MCENAFVVCFGCVFGAFRLLCFVLNCLFAVCVFFSGNTFLRRVLQKIVGVYHTMQINKHHSTHIVSIRIPNTY